MVPHLTPPHVKWVNTWEPHEEACRYFIFHFFKDFGQTAQCEQALTRCSLLFLYFNEYIYLIYDSILHPTSAGLDQKLT